MAMFSCLGFLLFLLSSALACDIEVTLDSTTPSYTVETPNYPNLYPSDQDCTYRVNVPADALGVTVYCPVFDVKNARRGRCSDYFEFIADGISEGYCGSTTDLLKQYDSDFVELHFVSSGRRNRRDIGVQCIVSYIEPYVAPATRSDDCPCGARNTGMSRIIGGTETFPNEYPYQVVLRSNSMFHFCGASLISDEWVLTAAHCVDSATVDDFWITLGDHHKYDPDETDEVTMRASEVIIHADWDTNTIRNDIALIKLSSPVEFTDTISPVCLPYSELSISGQTGYAIGWGRTEYQGPVSLVLLDVELNLLTADECLAQSSYNPNDITDFMICGEAPDQGTCNGDSGGAVLMDNNGFLELRGIVSFGVNCVHDLYPSVFTNVAEYITWIETNTEKTDFCQDR
ncbi:UNVERIFIED_CONTAM: hypothetical protein GTU68_023496 [Idotea baltica]|nr:hypothetical protein [Idotea baltica]